MILGVLSFLSSPLGKIVGIAAAALVAGSLLWGMYRMHVNSIEQAVLLKQQVEQLQQVVQDQKVYLKQTQILQNNHKELVEMLKTQKKELDEKFAPLEQWLDTPEATTQDRGSSEVLKRTMRALSNEK